MLRLFVLVAVLFVSVLSKAVAVDLPDEVLESANNAIDSLYKRLSSSKAYELKDLNRGAIQLDPYGLRRIDYAARFGREFQLKAEFQSIGDQGALGPYEVRLLFPLVHLVLVIQLSEGGTLKSEIEAVAAEATRELNDLQQKYNPLKLMIQPGQSQYWEGQDVEFTLNLRNYGGKNLRVKEIDERSTYCLFNEELWGSKEPSGPDSVILRPGESVKKKVRLSNVRAGAIDIYCSYGVGYLGVRPWAREKIIVK